MDSKRSASRTAAEDIVQWTLPGRKLPPPVQPPPPGSLNTVARVEGDHLNCGARHDDIAE
jgi:hypothetical protein